MSRAPLVPARPTGTGQCRSDLADTGQRVSGVAASVDGSHGVLGHIPGHKIAGSGETTSPV